MTVGWDCNFRHCSKYSSIPGLSKPILAGPASFSAKQPRTADVSLITGDLRPPPAWKSSNDSGSLALTPRPQLELAESSPAASFLSSRSWQGLEPRLGQTPVTEAVSGRRGIAIAYEDEGSG
uniref:Testis cDNA clone: QtsA-16852, similar to human DPH2-like 2 (S. cerevisiae) (DPH2L2), transcript variant2 n=1 Tax=Macaca fascicularis TaxID=9541 RepID=Q4R3H7_MACFA|nr:unnamed protein product [Macaca fascicularis]